ncbi:hypothetical protein ACU8KH_04146 [Lachancea thermotolerans]
MVSVVFFLMKLTLCIHHRDVKMFELNTHNLQILVTHVVIQDLRKVQDLVNLFEKPTIEEFIQYVILQSQ